MTSLSNIGTPSELAVDLLLKQGQARIEKCELKEAGRIFECALDMAKEIRSPRAVCNALAHLLRHSSELGDEEKTQCWIDDLELVLGQTQGQLTPHAWYCKGIVAFRKLQYRRAQILFHRFLKSLDQDPNPDLNQKAKALLALAYVAQAQGKLKRALYLGSVILSYAEDENPRAILTSTYLLLGRLAEKIGQIEKAKIWLQKAFAQSISEHNWYHYLFVLFGNARICRLEQNYIQAQFYLDLLEKAVGNEDLHTLKQDIVSERSKLNLRRVDLQLDVNRGMLRTRETEINLRRQHLLLEILVQLVNAPDHRLSKEELIERVWKEKYVAEVHDGKLYYNINRLRKLIEPDQKVPQYLLSWRKGYRISPEMKIQLD